MASTITVEKDFNAWSGGVAPMKASYGKLMMWFFLLSDAFTFSGLLIAYGYVRFRNFAYDGAAADFISSANYWPIPEKVYDSAPFLGSGYPLVFVGIMTFILIMSSVTMVLAVEAGHRMDKIAVEKWMLWTILGGFTFLGCQAWEWAHFIHGTDTVVSLAGGALNGAYAKLQSGGFFEEGVLMMQGEHLKMTLEPGFLFMGEEFAGATELTISNISAAGAVADPLAVTDFASIVNPETVKVVVGEQSFTGVQATELVSSMTPVQGANLTQNEYGPPAFADFFFFITGFHGTHVFSGVIINVIIFYNVATNLYQQRGHYEMVEKVGLYWHFVDLVWVFVFTFFYLV